MNKLRRLKISALLALALTCSQGNVFAMFGSPGDPTYQLFQRYDQARLDADTSARNLQTEIATARNTVDEIKTAGRTAEARMTDIATNAKHDLASDAQHLVANMGTRVQQELDRRIQPTVDNCNRIKGAMEETARKANEDQKLTQQAAQQALQTKRECEQNLAQQIVAARKEANEAAYKQQVGVAEEKERIRLAGIVNEEAERAKARRALKDEAIQDEIDKQKAMLQGQRELEQMKADMAEAAEMRLAQNPDLQKSRQEMEAVKAAANRAAGFKAEVKAAEIQAKSAERQMALKIKGLKSIMGSIGSGLSDKKKMATVGGTIAGTLALYIAAKHGIPLLFDALVQPKVVSETSKKSLFGSTVPSSESTVDELTFAPALQNALNAIAMQLKTAQQYNENLPNILFAGPPGTGKTAFAKAIARIKDAEGENIFDYALTTGSQFIKIAVKDLNRATSELRKLIGWAKKGNKPMIIFIDEAEALFANRTSPDTPKYITDMINEFLGLVQDKSQKNISFIFATNHPFKLDDAILNRVGLKVEFTLPGTVELSKILKTYVNKFAQANPDALVKIAPEFMANLDTYAQALVGCAPRDVRFVAEQAISRARRSNPAVLTHNIALTMLKESQAELEKVARWEKERNDYRAKQQAVMARG